MSVDVRTNALTGALAAVLAAVLLAGCSQNEAETPPAKVTSMPGDVTSKPGDVISAEVATSTAEAPSCEGMTEFKITITDGVASGKGQVLTTEAGKPVKLSVTTLEPTRVELSGSQLTLVHTQRGVNLLCLVYETPGKYNVMTGGTSALVVEVAAGE